MRSVFCGFPVSRSRKLNKTKYEFELMTDTDSKEVGVKVEVDLANSIARAISGEIPWEKVEVDVGEGHSATRLSARWPEESLTGMLYLEQTFAEKKGLTLPPPGFKDRGQDYEFQTVYYWERPENPARSRRRYYGFHTEIIKVKENWALVAVYKPATSRDYHPLVAQTEWYELSNPERVDLDTAMGGLTHIRLEEPKAWEGALFIERNWVSSYSLPLAKPSSALLQDGGKLPNTLGPDGIEYVEVS